MKYKETYNIIKGRIMRITAIIIMLVSISVPSYSIDYNPDNLPVMYLQDRTKYVSNPDGVLSQRAVDIIDSTLYSLEHKKGVQSIVAVVKRIEGGDAYSFAIGLGRKYGVGTKANTGIVIVLASEDRTYYIVTGEGLEKFLPDAICKRVENRQMVPYLKEGNWDQAMVNGVVTIAGILEGDSTLVKEYTRSADEGELSFTTVMIIILLFMIFISVIAYKSNQMRTRCPYCKKGRIRAVKTDNFIDREGFTHSRTTYVCPNCGKTHVKDEIDDSDDGIGGPFAGGIFMGGLGRHGGFGGGGGLGGGSFGGGSFGGGGAGGRF